MAQFTSGKFAKAICDRCGDKVKYKDLIEEWTGLRVCETCLDPEDPLEFPRNFPVDPEALQHPRPDTAIEAGEGIIRVSGKLGKGFSGIELELEVGQVTVSVA